MATDKKRPAPDESQQRPAKKNQTTNGSTASPQDGASETPYQNLLRLLDDHKPREKEGQDAQERGVIVWWMRMRDLRLSDNRALAVASQLAKNQAKHLVVLHVLSPGDYRSHDRSPRRIDFVLRNLIDLRTRLHKLNIPLCTITIEPRQQIPEKIIELISTWGTCYLTANIEHEVDELRRDIQVLKLARENNIEVDFVHDTCLVEPGKVLTKENKPYSVFSPWQRNWANLINSNLDDYIAAAEDCQPNSPAIKEVQILNKLFDCEVPTSIPGFELSAEDSRVMHEHWKAGEQAAEELLHQFLNSPLKSESSKQTTLTKNGKASSSVETIIQQYSTLRNRPDLPGTSRLSAYLAAGVISPRACVRATFQIGEKGKKPVNGMQVDRRDLGVGMWQSELGWRDFYQHVLAAWPRVCMGKAFNLKYEEVVWENDEEIFEKWKEGMTGYPFIDACMRQLKHIGYMHNRGRMCVAMFLTKDLMMDWRRGEKWFMENLVDGDLGSNNGGWQWSASTGTDAQPYFRIFAPLSQSEKSDPNGDFIRHWVPELKSLTGKSIHAPFDTLASDKFKKLNYPKPIVDHSVVRKRALARYKTPGSSANS
ncbi:hypothetical protein PTTG_08253 [Puccinia triticina 1-1 BBBD Race 1]|uniref:Photolyase/cryptochrome alpha/beta domain-containing protein n=2 Tax=Puccinia triticina TaxID=208348 RepID=A0A180GEV7_PUCT1|nr:uncharacterized protein PtA15_5A524 [Puccinia triticina]OAV91256.1 hypothetical protein PTTG_08253 [Puccinia triticina 1-1 BBBD Race 1]WAQ84951.1 hypothetical protein PtA15_5A524 [Puccinia triticina]WAR58286.1 hypothetical protein PtB15_5B520 [Puccinia triticina]